eukprot:TRINITY_DN485_c0_g1_i3.p1 TRINITY_DN485_c0_g1~~TRINITY_DN485_c0_g1_i3.p1  ORF type:complete len:1020 (-),score=251.96 TRINITY_DN485_c0_g1_i3:107-3139(-)
MSEATSLKDEHIRESESTKTTIDSPAGQSFEFPSGEKVEFKQPETHLHAQAQIDLRSSGTAIPLSPPGLQYLQQEISGTAPVPTPLPGTESLQKKIAGAPVHHPARLGLHHVTHPMSAEKSSDAGALPPNKVASPLGYQGDGKVVDASEKHSTPFDVVVGDLSPKTPEINPFEIAGAGLVPAGFPETSEIVVPTLGLSGLSMPRPGASGLSSSTDALESGPMVGLRSEHPVSVPSDSPLGLSLPGLSGAIGTIGTNGLSLSTSSLGLSLPSPGHGESPAPLSIGLSFPTPGVATLGSGSQGLSLPSSTGTLSLASSTSGLAFPTMTLGDPVHGPIEDPKSLDPFTQSLISAAVANLANESANLPITSGISSQGSFANYVQTSGVGMAPPTIRDAPVPGNDLRTNGLGYMAVIHDRLLSHLLQRLIFDGPKAFFPLLLTSKAMYQFANWEKIWKKIALVMSPGDFYYEWSWKYTVRKIKERQDREKRELQCGVIDEFIPGAEISSSSDSDETDSECETESEDSFEVSSASYNVPSSTAVVGCVGKVEPGVPKNNYPTLHVNGFYSEYMYRKWYRRQADLSSFVLDTGHIPRVTRLTEADFIVNYDKPHRPCIMTDVVPFWPAFHSWKPDVLALRFPDAMIKLSQVSPTRQRVKMTMMEYLTYMRRNNDHDPLYAFDSKIFNRIPELRADYKIPSFLRQDYFSVLPDEQRPMYRWVVMGPAHSGTGFHQDPNGTSAWNALISGRKRWAFYPPHQTPPGLKTVILDKNRGKNATIVDYNAFSPLRWYYEVFPFLQPHEKPIEVVQGPGEMLYVPAGWWHMVLNLEETVSVTQNFVNDQNLGLATLVLYNTPGRKLLKLWLEKLYESHPAVFKQVKRRVEAIKGAQTRQKYKKLKAEYKEERNKWIGEKEALEVQIKSLHKTQAIPPLSLYGVGLSFGGLGVGAKIEENDSKSGLAPPSASSPSKVPEEEVESPITGLGLSQLRRQQQQKQQEAPAEGEKQSEGSGEGLSLPGQ